MRPGCVEHWLPHLLHVYRMHAVDVRGHVPSVCHEDSARPPSVGEYSMRLLAPVEPPPLACQLQLPLHGKSSTV